MIDKYAIVSAYPKGMSTYNEINILSDNLIYSEFEDSHCGVQCNNMDNQERISKICQKISKLVKELDMLTK